MNGKQGFRHHKAKRKLGVKSEKRQKMEAMKEQIRAEDVANGIFIPMITVPLADPKKG